MLITNEYTEEDEKVAGSVRTNNPKLKVFMTVVECKMDVLVNKLLPSHLTKGITFPKMLPSKFAFAGGYHSAME